MTGICLLCGFVTPDLDVLDVHVARHEVVSRRGARRIWGGVRHLPDVRRAARAALRDLRRERLVRTARRPSPPSPSRRSGGMTRASNGGAR